MRKLNFCRCSEPWYILSTFAELKFFWRDTLDQNIRLKSMISFLANDFLFAVLLFSVLKPSTVNVFSSQTTPYVCLYVWCSTWPNTLYLSLCFLITLNPTQWIVYMFGNPLETQNLAYCVGQNQLIVLVMRCRLKHGLPRPFCVEVVTTKECQLAQTD